MRRAGLLLLALGAAALSAGLAWHHPVAPVLLLMAAACAAATAAFRPAAAWPRWLLPLLPLVGFMPWTGWLVVEELDVLLLAVAAGGYARWAVGSAAPASPDPPSSPSSLGLAVLCLSPALLSMVVSVWRGTVDAGGLSWGWWQGYHEPLNSLRLAKPLAAVLLLLPLAWRAGRNTPQAWSRALLLGMALMLAAVAWGVWWERWAYTGLLDFSTDYRATGLFWEMHVGGAALDAALCMAFPFAFVALKTAPAGWRQAGILLLLMGAAYAALATFSRVVYAGVPLAMGLAWWLGRRQAPAAPSPGGAGAGLAWALGVAVMAAWLFPMGGYRALLALLGAAALVLACAEVLRPLSGRAWGQGLLMAVLAVFAVVAVARWLPKGAYVAYALSWCSAAALTVKARRSQGRGSPVLVAACFAVWAAMVAVGVHWGGVDAWVPGLVAAAVLALVLMGTAARRTASWPVSPVWQAQVVAALVVLSAVIGVFGGGAYMGQRLTQTGNDGGGRQAHWQRVLSWMDGADWWVGKGLGRFVANFGLSGRTDDQVGDYRLTPGEGNHGQVLVLTGGKHPLGNGELFRVSQRIPVPAPGPLTLDLQIRADQPTAVHVEVTEKHLLYPMAYTDSTREVPKPGAPWQAMHFELKAADLTGGPAYAPRWVVFSIALDSPGRRVELDQLDLRDSTGRSLLANGDFEQGLARWFSSSDRNHMPWHAKNVAVHVLFEQGLLGLLAVALAAGVAFWRVTAGAARAHLLAPALAGALAGVAVVGIGDSLFDMPRIAWLVWWLVAAALLLPGKRA